MDFDDIIYLGLLFFSIGFGYYYRSLKQPKLKQQVGTIVGILIVFCVSGWHIFHTFITVFINACIILFIDKRQCHLVSFVFSFLYLFFFRSTIYFGIPYPPAHTNMVQMILTLKMVGLAMEVNTSYNASKKRDGATKTKEEELEDESNIVKVEFLDVFHYAFNYVGVLTGPYYRYRTFKDSFTKPFCNYDDYKSITLQKLRYVPLYAVLFLWSSYNWPLSYALTDEFYIDRSWFYRYFYIWPNFFTFRMRIYIGLVLSECACTMAGIGVYPAFTNPKSGHGPSENFQKMNNLKPNEMKSIEYNYETIHNINPYGADFCTTYRDGMKNWNICVQYWLAVNVYKRFPIKPYRLVVTMLTSAIWHGIYTGYYVCIATVPLVLPIEDVWVKILLKDKKGLQLKVNEWIVWFFKMQMFSYQSIAFHLMELSLIYKYYNSVYHCCLILYFALYIVGLQILKMQKRKNKKVEVEEKWEQEKKID